MPRISLWQDGRRSNDYKFFDRRISETFTAGGTSVFIHKYLGPNTQVTTLTVTSSQVSANVNITVNSTANVSVGQYVFGNNVQSNTKVGAVANSTITLTKITANAIAANSSVYISSTNDPSKPIYTQDNESNIQDLLLLENRDRKYDPDIYDLRGIYNVQDLDFDLSQFGLFLQNDTVFVTFHLNDMVERLGRKIMSGDVIELPHLKDFYSLDQDVGAALKRFYVVKDAIRSAEGYSATWWPHLWRIKATPLVDSQEYKQILNQIVSGTGNTTVGELVSTADTFQQINDAVIAAAEQAVPASGYDTTPFWHPPYTNGDRLQAPLPPDSSPTSETGGYLVGDGIAPNGYATASGTSFPSTAAAGDFFLRLDFMPNRLFKYTGNRWTRVEDNVRTNITPGNGQTLRDRFVNNNSTFTNSQGVTEPTKQNLSNLLKPDSDF